MTPQPCWLWLDGMSVTYDPAGDDWVITVPALGNGPASVARCKKQGDAYFFAQCVAFEQGMGHPYTHPEEVPL